MGLTSPLPANLAQEAKRAMMIFNAFVDPVSGMDRNLIPSDIIRSARGFAILTIVKAGFLVSGRAGSGIVVARLSNGGWSAPSAIGTAGLGFGGQAGAELTEFLIVLNSKAAVTSFMSKGSLTLGGNMSIAVGPLGRNAEGSGAINTKGKAAMMYSYSRTRGLFGGVSIEGSVIVERSDANAKAYGRNVSAKQLLSGSIEVPSFAEPLLQAIASRAGSDIDARWVDDSMDSPGFDKDGDADYMFSSASSRQSSPTTSRSSGIRAFASKRFGSNERMPGSRRVRDEDSSPARSPVREMEDPFAESATSTRQSRSNSMPHRMNRLSDAEEDDAPGRPSLDTISSDKADDEADLWRAPDREALHGGGGGRWRSNSDATVGGRTKSAFSRFTPSRKASPAPADDFVVPPSSRTAFSDLAAPRRSDARSRSSSSATMTKSRYAPPSSSMPSWGGSRQSLDSEGHDDLIGLESEADAVRRAPIVASGLKPRRPAGGDFGASDPSDEEDLLVDVSSDEGHSHFNFGGMTERLATVNLAAGAKRGVSPSPGFLKTDTRAASYSSAPKGHAIALFDFEGAEAGDLAFRKNDVIVIVDRSDPDWWTGRIQMRDGLFPANRVQVVD